MPRESFARDLQVGSSPSACWEALTDVDRVADWVGVVDNVREIGRLESYTALLADKVGPFSMRADLAIEVTELITGEKISFRASGEDRQVSSKLTVEAAMTLAPSDSGTVMSVSGHYQVTGRIASLGASWITIKATMVLEEFFAAAKRELD